MSHVRILGIDPGFRNIGLFGLKLTGVGSIKAEFVRVIVTKRADKKRKILEADDELRSLEEIRVAFREVMADFKPDFVVSEERPKLRSQMVTAQIAMAFSAMYTITRAWGVPFLVVAIPDIKLRATGSRKASKDDMVRALKGKFPGFKGWSDLRGVEHVADAGGAALCATTNTIVEMLLRERAK